MESSFFGPVSTSYLNTSHRRMNDYSNSSINFTEPIFEENNSMNRFFKTFKKSSLNDWKDQIIKDLKGKEHATLEFNDPIEEIKFKAYYHQDEVIIPPQTPGNFPFKRGYSSTNNFWSNAALILIQNEKIANQEALAILMNGANMLVFKSNKNNCDWEKVLQGIQLEYIESQFIISTKQDFLAIKAIDSNASIAYDHLAIKNFKLFEEIIAHNKTDQSLALKVNGFGVQQAGATSWQEVAFCLNVGHEYLLQLMTEGLTIDEASKMIHFHIGIGNNYFNEISKLRTLRQLWSKLIQAYSPKNQRSFDCNITAIIGHVNKSLRDPYTNLLRQTTEVMSALNGANAILVLPYDFYSDEGPSSFAKRMAINLALLLQEEAYLDKVIDPIGGSYSIETLTELIGEKSWNTFQGIEKNGGLFEQNALNVFAELIMKKQNQRVEAFSSGKTTRIGINDYEDPNEKVANWKEVDSYLGMKPLILDLQPKKSEK